MGESVGERMGKIADDYREWSAKQTSAPTVGPTNARTGPGGIRIYTWTKPDGEKVDVLSVTSIRKLCGESMNLVNWQLANVVNLAMGTRQVVYVGPRGGVRKKYVPSGEPPGDFVRQMLEANGDVPKLAELRKWLRDQADEPRDVAGVRGSVVHKLIELNAREDQLGDAYIASKFEEQWAGERRKIKRAITEDDFNFVRGCIRQYWNMRASVPFVILAAEPQCWNLEVGYAGSFDALLWFLPEGPHRSMIRNWQLTASKGEVTIETIKKIGGELVLGDWKTSADLHTDGVTQLTAYLAAEFVGKNGVVDERISALLKATMRAALVHIRPNKWSVQRFPMRSDALGAFLGACRFARFLAINPTLETIVDESIDGVALGTEPSEGVHDDE